MRRNVQRSRKHRFRQMTMGGIGFLIVISFFIGNAGKSIAVSETLPFYNRKIPEGSYAFKFFSGNDPLDENEFQDENKIREVDNQNEMIGLDDVSYQPEISPSALDHSAPIGQLTEEMIARMDDVGFLKQNFYIVDARTELQPGDVKAKEYLQRDFAIDNKVKGPKVLIFHTHSTEGYADSDMSKDMSEGIWGVGEQLKQLLEQKYGIETIHDTGRYDMVDGKGHILGAYERMEAPIAKVLKENPTVQVVIDMHRDGLPDNVHLVTDVNGKKCARIMFCNGLCKLKKDGNTQQIANLPNPYIEDNMAFSLQIQTLANQQFPSFTRKMYLNAYRYSLHMRPRSLLIEVGSQTNTKEEAKNAMEPFSELLAKVIQ